ncbi:hypothetical protein MLD38_030731 [Melastoma candidum]|uniref:Uncharacterized protein n=1 Tax=Melastoma candidum TaxID=119954 RepID=A0ACB9MML3_9MYRT|nr:hypothetical protein MLD38_030731 [Melastoma candidum]
MVGSAVCLRLKEMGISGSCIDPDLLCEGFFSRFPLLEKLRVSRCPTILRINISSPRIKSVYLDNIHHLEDVRIEAPKLCSFHYMGNRTPLLFSNFPGVDMPELRRRCVPPSTRHRILVGGRGCYELPSLTDALLWSCRPRSLTVCPGFPKKFVKVLYEKVTGPNLWNVEMEKLSLSRETGWLRRWSLDTGREHSPPSETFARLLHNFPGSEALSSSCIGRRMQGSHVDKGLSTAHGVMSCRADFSFHAFIFCGLKSCFFLFMSHKCLGVGNC